MTKITKEHYTSNPIFLKKMNTLLEQKKYSSLIIGLIQKNFLVVIDTELYFFNIDFTYHKVNLADIKVGLNELYTYSNKRNNDLWRFDFDLRFPMRLSTIDIKKLKTYIESLKPFAKEIQDQLPLIWISHQYLKPYFIAYYIKYEERFNMSFLNVHTWLDYSKETFENPLIFLSDVGITFRTKQFHLPNDMANFTQILKQKIKTSYSDLVIHWLSIYGLRQIALELNTNTFDETFNELKDSNTTDITKLLLILHNSPYWKNELNKFLFYYLDKNHLANKINSDQLKSINSSIVETNKNIQFDSKTIMLEQELALNPNINEDITNSYASTLTDIDLMTGLEFEAFCGKLFEKLGYLIQFTPSSGDQGIDLIANKNFQTIGIQVKRYSKKVTNTAIQEVAAGIKHYSLQKGLVITNNYFTDSAIELAASNNVILWDRDILKLKLREISNN